MTVTGKFTFIASALMVTAMLAANVKVEYDHADGLYAEGDTASFTVTVTDSAGLPLTNGAVRATLDNFGPESIADESFDLSRSNPFTVKGKLDHPGFLRIELVATNVPQFPSTQKNGQFIESVAFSPEKIRPGAECPSDLIEFWKDAYAKYTAEFTAPPEIVLDEDASTPQWDVWRVSFEIPGGRKLHAFLSKEKGANGRLPARVQYGAAGYGAWSQRPTMVRGHVSMFITVYPFEPCVKLTKRSEYDALNAATLERWGVSSYVLGGIAESRESYFFYPVILGGLRAVEWLAARDDVDADRLTYTGESQGGGLGLALVALSGRFKRAAFYAPALTGIFGYKSGFISGGLRLVERHPPEQRAEVEKNAPYFDGANFATHVRIPVRVVTGYSDTTCPSQNVWAMYNVLASEDKRLIPVLRANHVVPRSFVAEYNAWLDEPISGKRPEAK